MKVSKYMTSYGITDRGLVRQVNEDDYYISDTAIGCLPNLYLVADGMGGHNAGDVASRECIRFFVEYMTDADFGGDPEQLFDDAFNYANDQIFNMGYGNPDLKGMGNTLVAMSVFGDKILIGNVGDSRLYSIGDGFDQVTVDHSVVEELFRAGEITETEKFHHPDRNMITRAMGVDVPVVMDFFQLDRQDYNALLLCSDGLTKMMTDVEIAGIIKGEDGIKPTVDALLEGAIRNGGHDNVTMILVDLQKEGQE